MAQLAASQDSDQCTWYSLHLATHAWSVEL